jgi:hypothetical protein
MDGYESEKFIIEMKNTNWLELHLRLRFFPLKGTVLVLCNLSSFRESFTKDEKACHGIYQRLREIALNANKLWCFVEPMRDMPEIQPEHNANEAAAKRCRL